MLGGQVGATNEIVISRPGGDYRPPHWSKDEGIAFTAGDRIQIRTPGGGGYGDPLTRPVAQVAADVRAGYYTPEEALDKFGVALLGQPLEFDPEKTERARRAPAETGQEAEARP